jgi:hypothetical protein
MGRREGAELKYKVGTKCKNIGTVGQIYCTVTCLNRGFYDFNQEKSRLHILK